MSTKSNVEILSYETADGAPRRSFISWSQCILQLKA